MKGNTFYFNRHLAVEAGAEFTVDEIMWFKDSRGYARSYFYDKESSTDISIYCGFFAEVHEVNRALVLKNWLTDKGIPFLEVED